MNITLIDGRSGSGKSSLAAQLAEHAGADILPLDALYPGWNGLAAGSRALAQALRTGAYRRYDWHLGRFAEEVMLDPSRPLIVEGCGSLTRPNLIAARERAAGARVAPPGAAGTATSAASGEARLVHTIWLVCDEGERKRRALARDGETFAPHWQQWAEQEETHFASEQPIALAREIRHTCS